MTTATQSRRHLDRGERPLHWRSLPPPKTKTSTPTSLSPVFQMMSLRTALLTSILTPLFIPSTLQKDNLSRAKDKGQSIINQCPLPHLSPTDLQGITAWRGSALLLHSSLHRDSVTSLLSRFTMRNQTGRIFVRFIVLLLQL